MEFGIFIQGYTPEFRRAGNPNAEWDAFASDIAVAQDRETAYRSFIGCQPNYLVSNVFRYHDTFPAPPHVPAWPARIPEPTREDIPSYLDAGALLLGDPDDALAQAKTWESVGVDQLVFGVGPAPLQDVLRTIELIGAHVIPKLDTDPEHRTSAFRRTAASLRRTDS